MGGATNVDRTEEGNDGCGQTAYGHIQKLHFRTNFQTPLISISVAQQRREGRRGKEGTGRKRRGRGTTKRSV